MTIDSEELVKRMKAFGLKGVRNESAHFFIKPDLLAEFVKSEILAEREACAAECERMVMYPGGRQEAPAHNGVWEAARAIRMRSNA